MGSFQRLFQAVLGVVTLTLLAGPPALADSVRVSSLPDSTSLQATVTVRDQDSSCDSATNYCSWYGEASAYPVSLNDAETGGNCPSVFDPARGIWVGDVIGDPSATDTESFAFAPPASSGPIEICLYTTDGATGDTFDTSGFGAATKLQGTVNLYLKWVVQCRVSVNAYVNGGNVIDGKFLFAVKRHGNYKTLFAKSPVSAPNWWFEWGRGSYTISVKFLGDTFVNPSPWVSIAAQISRCSKSMRKFLRV
jgi:hypothetical protein